jgi:hypothetical protein
MPSTEVLRATGMPCPAYTFKEGLKEKGVKTGETPIK